MDWEQIPDLDLNEISDVWMHMSSLGLVLKCCHCQHQHEQIQQTFSGLAFGVVTCPSCHAKSKMTPELFETVLSTWIVEMDVEEALAVNQDVTSIVESWHQDEIWQSLLEYKGTNLGEPTERELACYVNSAFSSRKPGEVTRG